VQILPIIETVRGLYNAPYISNHDRVPALSWGGEDLTAQIGVSRAEAGELLKSVRVRIVLAAKLHGKQALDTVYGNVGDTDGLYQNAIEARQLGFDGKGVIHPGQIDTIHAAFTPSEEEVANAKAIVKAIKDSKGGVVSLNGKMIDKPVAERARKLLALARASKTGGAR
jgi:citrate lyase subunit beta/citryl-CoA lyase